MEEFLRKEETDFPMKRRKKMSENKNPAFLFYPSDFITGTAFMSYEDKGKYITLLCLQHQHGHLSKEKMLNICGTNNLDIFEKFEIDNDGKYYNLRLENEAKKRQKYVESRRENRSKKTYVKHMENENINENLNNYIINNNFSNNIKEIIISWLDYKLQRNENYLERGFKSLLTIIKNNIEKFGEEKVIEIINSSMSSNYKGIIWDKLKSDNKKSYKTNYELGQEVLRQARGE